METVEHIQRAKNRIEDLWIRGTDYSVDIVAEAQKHNRLLHLDMDMTGECELNCYYCDRTPDRFNEIQNRKELSTEDRKSLIRQAKDLGATTIEFPGAGEPMKDVGFWEVFEYIHEMELIPVLFTSGYHLDEESVDRLYNLGASVFMKYNSTDDVIQDRIVGKKGYGLKATQALELLIKRGFNKTSPTRMAIDMVVTPQYGNIEDIKDIFRFCRKNNIHNYIQTLIPEGRADRQTRVMEKERADNLIRALQDIDRDEFGLEYEPRRPMAGGYKCRQVNVGLFVNLFGEVYDCNGLGRFLGHTRINSLAEIWESKYASHIRMKEQDGFCLLRERYWNGTENSGMDRKLEEYREWESTHGADLTVTEGLEQRDSKKNETLNLVQLTSSKD
jgi:MoaA/NifB/PqqE/SkfB family radical SAM enzyme